MRPNRINSEIHAKEVRLISLEGEQLGILNIKEAIKIAQEVEADLIEINPNADPPVCRIMDYGKFLYEKSKFSKEQKKKQKIIQIKEIKFRPNIDESDYRIKLRSLLRFLKENNKTKITLRFRGRETTHHQIGVEVLHRIVNDLQEIAIVESFPTKIEGRQMIMILAPKKK